MEWYYILIICLAAVAALVILALFALALVSDRIAFGKRYDKDTRLKYFSYEEFSLSAEKITVKRGKYDLNGYVYAPDEANNNSCVVVFCHGMGAGQAAYTTEIAYFCGKGYTVVALDSLGCNLSGGKNMKGMYEGVKTAVAAVNYAKARFVGAKIYLVGHSWGGYSVLCASSEVKVDGVVALSAPINPVKTLYKGASDVLPKAIAALLCPFWWVINVFKYGFKGNANAVKCIKRSKTPALLVQGDRDGVVPMNQSAYKYADGEAIKKYLASGKEHNPYNSVAAQKMVAEAFAKLNKDGKNIEWLKEFDWKAATEEDETVMQAILDFMQSC